MGRREEIVWNGVKFYRYPDSKNKGCREYFTAAPVRLHRAVWEHHNGPIPDGYQVHHIDGDSGNNDISNLECLPAGEHQRGHWTPERRERQRQRMRETVQPASSAWHGTRAGRAWHAKRGRELMAARKPIVLKCEYCSQPFESVKHVGRFCSNNCKSAWRRVAGLDNVERVCINCGNVFTINRYQTAVHCSLKCAWGTRRRNSARL